MSANPFSMAPAMLGRVGTLTRYLLTGSGLFLLDLAIFLALVRLWGLEPLAAQLISRTVGAVAGFFGHRYITFFQSRKSPQHAIAMQGGGYMTVTLGMLFLTPLVLQFVLYVVDGHLIAAKLLTEVVAVIVVYLSLKVIFAAKGTRE